MELDLNGKNALVCGSSRGIGLAAARELALLGANVVLLARSAEALGKAVPELSNAPAQRHDFLVADLQDSSDLRRKVLPLIDERPIHILVNNTGGPSPGPILEANPQDFREAFERHLVAAQVLTQLLLPGMKKAGYGRIINVISTSVKTPLQNLGVSNTIRGAVASWAKTLANEIGAHGITVNNVLPGFTRTQRLEALAEEIAAAESASREAVLSRMAASVPLGRTGDPKELGAAIAFLASPAASYIHGINLPVDGGRTPAL